jgi:hypothetical protein
VRHHPARRATARFGVIIITAAAVAASTAATAASGAAAAASGAAAAQAGPAAGQARGGLAARVSASPGSAVPASSAPVSSAAGGPARSVLLANGDRLVIGIQAARPGVTGVLPGAASRLAGALLTLGSGPAGLAIPQVALPYLGRGLDPALFRLSSLLAAEPQGRLPVTVSYQGRVPALPGVQIISASGGLAQGYLTAAGARAFGAALARQFLADHPRGSYGQDGLFANGVSVSLAGSPAGAARAGAAAGTGARHSPAFPMHTLTVTATNLAGKPDTGDDVLVMNADNAILTPGDNLFDNGVTKFSVPAGHYWAIGDFFAFSKGGLPAEHLAVLPQFTVSGNTTVHMAAQTANSEITMVTSRPTVLAQVSVEFRHPTPAGNTFSASWGANFPIFVSPTTRRPTVGTLQVFTSAQLASPASAAGTPYQYNLAFADTSGLVPPEHHVVRQGSLATVHASYFSNVTGTGGRFRFGMFPIQRNDLFLIPINPFPVPAQETEYLTGNPAILWLDSYWQDYNNLVGGQSDDWRAFRAGEQATENWNAYPLHEGYNVDLVGAANPSPWVPSASRAGDSLTLDVTPFSDSTAGHSGNGGFVRGGFGPTNPVTGHYEIDQNGKVIASGNPLKGFKEIGPFGEFDTHVTLTPHPATIRFVLEAAGSGKIYALSTSSRTVWTWRSAHESGGTLPVGWTCKATFQGLLHPDRSCAAEPMLTLGYAVAGLSLSGSAPAGAQVVHVAVGHLQPARAAAITVARVAVSFDGGKTWHHAKVTGQAGSYTASFTAPPGAKVSLRASVGDAVGGTVTETVINAYQAAS